MRDAVNELEWLPSGRGSALEPLDAAVELLRVRLGELLPVYVVAVLPLSAAMLLAIDTVTARDRVGLTLASAALVAGLVWRWLGVAAVQCRVQAHLRGQAREPLAGRWTAIFLSRLVAAIAMTWGALLLVPVFFGFFFGAVITPALLERRRRAWPTAGQVLGWISTTVPRLLRIGVTLAAGLVLGAGAWIGVQVTVIYLVLPSLLGIEISGLVLTMEGAAWWLGTFFFLFLAFDFYWSVAAVAVYYEVQSKRLGSDLQRRLAHLKEVQA